MRLRQVLLNLAGNAIKFTSAGQVVVTLRLEALEPAADGDGNGDALIEFSVKDSGIGIAAEKQTVVFNEFAQAEASTTRQFGGTGLGLAISQRLVGLMGARIELESELGVGSTFSFKLRLPVADEQGLAADEQEASRLADIEALREYTDHPTLTPTDPSAPSGHAWPSPLWRKVMTTLDDGLTIPIGNYI
jgi:signal transduction histidine kinase